MDILTFWKVMALLFVNDRYIINCIIRNQFVVVLEIFLMWMFYWCIEKNIKVIYNKIEKKKREEFSLATGRGSTPLATRVPWHENFYGVTLSILEARTHSQRIVKMSLRFTYSNSVRFS